MARHIYLCPLRWADMDSLGHVNNVTYVDYLQEARVDMLRVHAPRPGVSSSPRASSWSATRSSSRAAGLPASSRCASSRGSPRIRAASFTMAYEIFDEQPDGGRRVYPRARTVLDAVRVHRGAAPPDPRRGAGRARALPGAGRRRRGRDDAGTPTTCHVRFSDVDVYGHVNNVKYFEYYQEARIAFILSLGRRDVRPAAVGDAARWSPAPTSTTGGRSCSAPSRTPSRPG